MADTLINDITMLRDVLRQNALEGSVGDDLLMDLLASRPSNGQRVNAVVGELEGILGRKLVAAMPRYNHDDIIEIPFARLVAAPEVNNNATKPQIAGKKRKTKPANQPGLPVAGPSGAKVRKVEHDHDQLTNVARIQAILQNQPKVVLTPVETKKPDDKETIAHTIYNRLMDVIHNVNPIFAAFKASELAMKKLPIDETGRFIERILTRAEAIVTSEVTWHPPAFLNSDQSDIYEAVKAKFFDAKVQFLISSLPHVEPAYLEKVAIDLNGNDQKIEAFIVEVCEGNRIVPLISNATGKKQYKEIVENFFTVQKLLDMYEDPLSHFKNDARVTDQRYRTEAFNQLKDDFRFAGVYIIRKTLREKNYHYTPAYLQLYANKDCKDRKTKRSDLECSINSPTDEFLLQEIAFVRLQSEIEAYKKNKAKKRLDALEDARAKGMLLECPICCEEELIEMDVVRCPLGHVICRQCVRRQSEEMIGLMKNHVSCLEPNCSAEYTLKDLKEVLPELCYSHLEKRRQAEEIVAANIEGLESCPFCEYCEVPPANGTLFQCKKPDCRKTSCRKCREPEHGQLSCEENSMKQKLANYVETKMTEALVRECPKCKKKFVKIDGCNKMVCVCGTIICYICRAVIKDYKHFENAQQIPGTVPKDAPPKCPLYTDTNKMHEEDVAKGAAQAKAELARTNPNVRVDLVLAKYK